MMKEYIVIAHSEPDIDSLHRDLTRDTREDLTVDQDTVPTRNITVANERLGNPRITHYFLTDDEAETLRNDPRVEDLHPLPNPMALGKTIVQKSMANDGRTGNFNRNAVQDPYNINWGLRRTSQTSAETRIGNFYEYNNDGTGVDIVIMDDGVMIDHPEFLDVTGKSRVQRIDWYKETGIPGKMPVDHYRATAYGGLEHGTHVAGIAAGKTFGYAKNSRIYSLRIFGNLSEAIDINDAFDLVRVWHSRKPVDPVTQNKRPTICNLSWAYSWDFPTNGITKVVYRNQVSEFQQGTGSKIRFGQKGRRHGIQVPSLDAEMQDAERAGVIFVQSAGNFGQKIDTVDGVDYNNYYISRHDWAGVIPAGRPIYYHRGSSPNSPNVIKVSAARDTTKFVERRYMEEVDSYSDRGPGCAIVAPGTNITSATSSTSSFPKLNYVWSGVGRTDNFFVSKQSGTSMSAPQVTGVLALYLSENPRATPAQAREWIINISIKDQILSSNSNSDWSNPYSLLGGPNRYLFNPFRKSYKS